MSLMALFYGVVAAVAEILGGVLVVIRTEWAKRVQEYLLALSAGFILALVFFELIPESFRALGEEASLVMFAGYAALHFFEHTVVGHMHFGEETHHDVMVSRTASFSTFAGLFVHAFFDGFAISAGMQFDPRIGLLIFIGVLLHKIPEGLTIASVMLAAEHRRRTALLASVAVGVATLLGVVTVPLVTSVSDWWVGMAFAFSAGLALYVGASDLVPEINASRNRIVPLVVFGGFLLFYFGMLVLDSLILHGP